MSRTQCLAVLLATIAAGAVCLIAQTAALPVNGDEADFAQLRHYRAANATLPKAGASRVVFLGDSLTEYWGKRDGTWFSNPGWLNRGIGGQTTQQLLLREHDDAIALRPRAIVIEGASNDMRLGFSAESIRDNIASIGEVAQANHIAVLIAAMTPVCDCVRTLTGARTVEHIHQLNALLAQLCSDRHWVYLDLNKPLAGPDGQMRAELTVDGVHLNDEGYRLLAPVMLRGLRSYR